jgi:hypothetical protein
MEAGIIDFFAGLGLRLAPKVWLIDGVGQPFVWGLLRGGIYLPGNFSQTNGDRDRRGVLGHELSHVMRYDAAVNLLQIIAQAIYWFHPFVWWANKKIREEREKCCDEMAIARLNTRPKDYGKAIVNTLIAEHRHTRPVPSLAVAGPVKNIEDRIKTIMKSGKRFYRRPTFITVVTVLLLAAVAVPTTLAVTRRRPKESVKSVAVEPELTVEGNMSAFDVVGAYLTALKAGRYGRAAELAHPDSAVGEQTPEFEEFREQGDVQEMEIAAAYSDEREALAVTTVMKGDHGRRGPLVFHLVTDDDKWLIDDIDLETDEKTQQDVTRFLEDHPEAEIIEGNSVNPVESAKKLQELGKALLIYANDDEGNYFPENLQKLQDGDYIDATALKYFSENVEYLAKGRTAAGPPDMVLAYDKSLLLRGVGTNVLFNDSHIEFIKPERLEELGISAFGRRRAGDWRKAFYEVYRLEEGQVLKRIAPPFIPEREDYYYEQSHGAVQEPPDFFTFHWDGQLRLYGEGWWGGKRPLLSVLRNNLSMGRDTFEGPEELLDVQVPGDWMVRKHSGAGGRANVPAAPGMPRPAGNRKDPSVGELLKALEKILKDEIGRDIRFVKRRVEREVIVATGRYRFRALDGKGDGTRVYMYSDKFDPDAGGGGGTAQSVSEFLAALANRVAIPVIDQTKSSGQITIVYDHQRSAYLDKVKDNAEKDKKLEILLKNLSEQTGLKFKRERRMVDKWFVTEAGREGGVEATSRYGGRSFAETAGRPRKAAGSRKAGARSSSDVQKQLDEVVNLSGLEPEMPFSEALDELKNSVEPPLVIVVLWRDLEENAEVDRTTPVNMDPMPQIRLGMALKLLLRSVSSGQAELGYVVDDGVIVIATVESLPSNLETRVYDLYGFLGPPADDSPAGGGYGGYGGGYRGYGGYGGGYGGYGGGAYGRGGYGGGHPGDVERARKVQERIIETIEPESWSGSGGEGSITIQRGRKLVVRQTPERHQIIESLLNKMRKTDRTAIAIESRFILVPSDANEVREFLGKEDIDSVPAFGDPNITYHHLDCEQYGPFSIVVWSTPGAKSLAAPKMTVLEGETAEMRTQKEVFYRSGYIEPNRPGAEPEPKEDSMEVGTRLKVLPKLVADSKYIQLTLEFEVSDLLGFEKRMYKGKYPYEVPTIHSISSSVRASVLNGGALIIAGKKVKAEEENGQVVDKDLFILIKAEGVNAGVDDAHALAELSR